MSTITRKSFFSKLLSFTMAKAESNTLLCHSAYFYSQVSVVQLLDLHIYEVNYWYLGSCKLHEGVILHV